MKRDIITIINKKYYEGIEVESTIYLTFSSVPYTAEGGILLGYLMYGEESYDEETGNYSYKAVPRFFRKEEAEMLTRAGIPTRVATEKEKENVRSYWI